MSYAIVDLRCPGCGNPANTGEKICKFCGRQTIISTFNSVYNMSLPEVNKYANAYRQALVNNPDNKDLNTSVAMCYLKLKLYDKALYSFEKAIEDNFDNSEVYFYAAVSLLKGKKAFLAARSDIDKIEEYINAALMIEPKGVYYYFWAYIKYDYFSRKSYITNPTYQEALAMAATAGGGVSHFDCQQLYAILGIDCPDSMAIY